VKHFSFWTMFFTTFFAFASMAEDADPAKEIRLKRNNVIGVVSNGTYGGVSYGRFLKNGAHEVNGSLLVGSIFSGFGARYRLYPRKIGKGLFYGGALDITGATEGNAFASGSVTVAFPGAEIGYRWLLESGLSITLSGTLGVQMVTVSAQVLGESASVGGSSAWMRLGSAIAWAF